MENAIKKIRKEIGINIIASKYLKLKKRGNDYIAKCPFHEEETPSLLIRPSSGQFICLGCGHSGDVIGLYAGIKGISYDNAVKDLSKLAGATISRKKNESDDEKEKLYAMYRKAAVYYYSKLREPGGENAMAYIEKRGLSKETITKFGLGYSPAKNSALHSILKKDGYSDELIAKSALFTYSSYGIRDKFWDRVMFPIMDIDGKVIAFGGRVMGDGTPKYLNSNETLIFDKSRNLYGLHLAKNTKHNFFILCEGYMDVIAMHQAGFDNAIASLGTSLTAGQARIIARYTKNVMISYDGDAPGIKAAKRAIPMLKEAGLKVRLLDMSPYKDPDEFIKALGANEYKKRLIDAKSDITYLAEHVDDGENGIKDLAEALLK